MQELFKIAQKVSWNMAVGKCDWLESTLLTLPNLEQVLYICFPGAALSGSCPSDVHDQRPTHVHDSCTCSGHASALGMAILAAASGVADFTIPVPPAIAYVDATSTPAHVHTGVDDRLSRLEGKLSEIKTMLSHALARKKRRV